MADDSSKQCIMCGKERRGLPRVRDPKGRYYCPECYEQGIERKKKLAAEHSSGNALASDENDDTHAGIGADSPVPTRATLGPSLLDDLVDDVVPAAKRPAVAPCESCGQPTTVDAIICTSCGYNRQTGEKLKIETAKPETDWVANSGMFVSPGVIGGGIMAVFGIMLFIGRTVEPVAIALILSHSLFAIAITLTALFFAFRESIVQGLLTLFLPFYILWFVYGVHDGPYLKWLYGAMIVGAVCVGALAVMIGADAISSEILRELQR